MVGSYRIAQQGQDARIFDIANRIRLFSQPFKEWWVLDIGGVVSPVIHFAFREFDPLPYGITIEHGAVFFVEHLGVYFSNRVSHFLLAWP